MSIEMINAHTACTLRGTQMFYALEYTYGYTTVDEDGDAIATVHRFATRRAADAFVAAGPDVINESGYRARASARHPLVRSAITYGMWQPAEDARGEVEA